MAKVRGLSYTAIMNFVKQNYGEESYQKVLGSLSEEDKKIFMEKFVTMTWYPVKPLFNFLGAADVVLGKQDEQIPYLIGQGGAENMFGGIFKYFLEVGRPHTIIRRAHLAWSVLNDSGRLELEVLKENFVRGRILNYDNPDKNHCAYLRGYFTRVLEISGAKELKLIEEKCHCRGDDYCEFAISWQ